MFLHSFQFSVMTATTITNLSPFIFTGLTAKPNDLAILHLKRDLLVPTVLRSYDESNEGYSEGKVSNTRFGSFPHSTLIGLSWGSQVRASAVDTGSRGRKNGDKGKKRKRGPEGKDDDDDAEMKGTGYGSNSVVEKFQMLPKAAVTASTGFVHLLPPTPETWTAALPHRTQVVYTPDYSYILHRIRARPGSVLIEAGAGSGSFTHAAARAVFNGYPDSVQSKNKVKLGKVWSYEFHEQRFQKLKIEIEEHGLDAIVEITHKDVCQDGFRVESRAYSGVNANAIFLDLPAPWLALKHLVRNRDSFSTQLNQSATPPLQLNDATSSNLLLDPRSSIYLCTFSPCIEQVQRTISTLRKLGWHDIETVETSSKRFETKRERVGLQEEGVRGSNGSPASVDEALARLREVEGHSKIFHNEGDESSAPLALPISKQDRLRSIQEAQEGRKLYKAGRLVHRAEQELKMHTSYLVFAILPREWSLEDELAAQQRLPAKRAGTEKEGIFGGRLQAKRAAKSKAGGNKASEMQDEKPDHGPDRSSAD